MSTLSPVRLVCGEARNRLFDCMFRLVVASQRGHGGIGGRGRLASAGSSPPVSYRSVLYGHGFFLSAEVREMIIICLHRITAVSPRGSPSRGGDVAVYVLDINQPSLPTPFLYSVFVTVSLFMALSTVFHSINSPDNSPVFLLCSPGLISA